MSTKFGTPVDSRPDTSARNFCDFVVLGGVLAFFLPAAFRLRGERTGGVAAGTGRCMPHLQVSMPPVAWAKGSPQSGHLGTGALSSVASESLPQLA